MPGGITVAHPSGRLDLLTAAQLKQDLSRIVGEGQVRLVIALDGVTFIDSIKGHMQSSSAGGLEGCKPSEYLSYSPVQGDFVALHRRINEIFEGGNLPPNPHRVWHGSVICFSFFALRAKNEKQKSTAVYTA